MYLSQFCIKIKAVDVFLNSDFLKIFVEIQKFQYIALKMFKKAFKMNVSDALIETKMFRRLLSTLRNKISLYTILYEIIVRP
jgi:hypothetical protein